VGRGCRLQRHWSWYSTFAPFPDTCSCNQPSLPQTYATVVSGEQMLTVGRGIWTTATDRRAFPASGLAAVICGIRELSRHPAVCRLPCGRDAGSSCNGRHKLSADITHPRHAQHKQRHVVTLRYEASAEREARDTRTGLVTEPLVCKMVT